MEISVTTFSHAAVVFVGLIIIQFGVWRLKLNQKGEVLPLFLIFFFLPLVEFAYSQNVLATILIYSVSLPYILVFPAASAKSPSFEILYYVWSQDKPVPLNELQIQLAKPELIGDRMNDLSKDRLTSKGKLTDFGRLVAYFFYFYRNVIGLKQGTG